MTTQRPRRVAAAVVLKCLRDKFRFDGRGLRASRSQIGGLLMLRLRRQLSIEQVVQHLTGMRHTRFAAGDVPNIDDAFHERHDLQRQFMRIARASESRQVMLLFPVSSNHAATN